MYSEKKTQCVSDWPCHQGQHISTTQTETGHVVARRKPYTITAGIEPSTNLVRGLEIAHLWGSGQALSSSSSWSGTTSPLPTTLVTLTQYSSGGGHSEALFPTKLFICLSNKRSSTAICRKHRAWRVIQVSSNHSWWLQTWHWRDKDSSDILLCQLCLATPISSSSKAAYGEDIGLLPCEHTIPCCVMRNIASFYISKKIQCSVRLNIGGQLHWYGGKIPL